MTVEVTEVHLFNVEREEAQTAELWHAITEQCLADWEGEWLPELFRAMQRLRRAGVDRAHWPQSRHWDWRRKVEVLQGMLANPGFSIVCDGLTQGMMIVDTVKHRGRLDDQQGQHLVYVEFVENAPWNRAELFDPPRYRGVGSLADDRAVVGIERDRLDNDDKFMLHLSQVVRNGLGARAGTCIDPKVQIVDGKGVCVVSCQRSPEPVFLRWKGIETEKDGDFFARSGPGTVKLSLEDSQKYITTRFGTERPGLRMG